MFDPDSGDNEDPYEFPRPLPPSFPPKTWMRWYNENKHLDVLPPIYPHSHTLCARNEPKLENVSTIKYIVDYFWSVLFPKEVRFYYDGLTKRDYENFVSDEEASKHFREYIKYDEDELRIPFTTKPYIYIALLYHREDVPKHIEWVKTIEKENVAKLSIAEKEYYDKWQRLYTETQSLAWSTTFVILTLHS